MECIKYQLGNICKISAGQGAPQGEDKYTDTGTPFIKAGNLLDLVYGLDETKVQQVSDEIIASHRLKIYPAGSVVFAKSGASCLKGYVYVLQNNCCVVSHLAILTPKDNEKYNPQYLCYFLKYNKPNQLVADWAYPAIQLSALSNFTIYLPNYQTQNAIVSELDKIQDALANKNEQLKKLDELIQSKFYEMFGDPIINEKGWEMKVLEKMGKIASGGTPSRSKSEYFLGNINWYSAGELNTLYLPDSIEHITEKALLESSAKLFPKGSLMIGMYDTAAFKLGILKKDSASNQACANIELYEDYVVWLYYTLKLMREEALRHRHGARQKNLNVTFIKSFSVPHPPLPLQKTFANFVEKVEEAKVIVNQEIAHLQELLDSRMDYYFRK